MPESVDIAHLSWLPGQIEFTIGDDAQFESIISARWTTVPEICNIEYRVTI